MPTTREDYTVVLGVVVAVVLGAAMNFFGMETQTMLATSILAGILSAIVYHEM
ncbi:MAG: hypothetical protein HY366_01430 [Candidatus Aenigmarchaeota archaeon]|nr:hypothetical protein [Candidatus Aenigmarchaeota archaeon]